MAKGQLKDFNTWLAQDCYFPDNMIWFCLVALSCMIPFGAEEKRVERKGEKREKVEKPCKLSYIGEGG